MVNQTLHVSLSEAMKRADPDEQVALLFAYMNANGQLFKEEKDLQ